MSDMILWILFVLSELQAIELSIFNTESFKW